MKKYFLITAILQMFFLSNLYSQTAVSDGVDKANEKKSGDDKSNFASYLNAVGNFVSNNGNTITIQPTLYSIDKIFKGKKITVDSIYSKKVFERNFELNLGITPDSSSIFKYSNAQFGLTYAIINDKNLTLKEYKSYNNDTRWNNYKNFITLVGKYEEDHPQEFSEISNFLRANDFTFIPNGLKVFLMQQFGFTKDEELENIFDFPKNFSDEIASRLSKKSLLTFGFNSIRDVQLDKWNEFDFTSKYSFYIFKNVWKKSPSITLTATYSIQSDTVIKANNLNRQTLNNSLGLNFIITKDSLLELKPGVNYNIVLDGDLYKKEKKTEIDPTATVELKLSKNFYLPITIEYNIEQCNFLGALSVLYSLK